MKIFRSCQPRQVLLLSPSLEWFLPEIQEVRIIEGANKKGGDREES